MRYRSKKMKKGADRGTLGSVFSSVVTQFNVEHKGKSQ